MFEDSTFESTGRIRTRSRGWMMAAFAFNVSILLALILIPLIYPEALPRQMMSMLLEAPPPPPAPQPTPTQTPRQTFHGAPEMDRGQLTAPRMIPNAIAQYREPEAAAPGGVPDMDSGSDEGASARDAFRGQRPAAITPAAPSGPIRVPSTIVAGLLLNKTIPHYPPIAVAAHIEGTVILQATISISGTIENLRVVSGPAMLQQAALDAVSNWRYRPYLLSGKPVEVETTVNVIFTLGR
jgi:protein TonB